MKTLSTVRYAELIATVAHAAVGQTRRYTEEPYIVHPKAVAELVYGVPHTPEMIAAAWLHDVLEDTQLEGHFLQEEFGSDITFYVLCLTNCVQSAGNRARRFQINAERLAVSPPEVQTIKIADLIDNTSSIVAHDPKFAAVYLQEKRVLLDRYLRRGDQTLWQRAWDQTEELLRRLPSAA